MINLYVSECYESSPACNYNKHVRKIIDTKKEKAHQEKTMTEKCEKIKVRKMTQIIKLFQKLRLF